MTARLRRLLLGERLLSPGAWLRLALELTILFALAHALGLREYTRVFSGTAPDWSSALLGASYAVLYLGFAVVVPILVIATVLLVAIQALARRVNGPR